MYLKYTFLLIATAISLPIGSKALGADPKTAHSIEIRFVQHRFVPQTIEVPAEMPLAIRVVNASRERIEFESFKLNREKVVEPGDSIVLQFPALRAGSYDFYDDFHDDVPEGTIVAR